MRGRGERVHSEPAGSGSMPGVRSWGQRGQWIASGLIAWLVRVAVAVLWPAKPQRGSVLVWGLAVVMILVGNITLHSHQPSDVIAAALLVSALSGVTIGILGPRPVRGPSE